MNNEKLNIFKVEITCLISAILLVIIRNLGIDSKLSYWVIPIMLFLGSVIYLIKKHDIEVNKKAYLFLIPIGLMLLSNLVVKVDDSNWTMYIILPIVISMFCFSLTNQNYKLTIRGLLWFFKFIPGKAASNLSYLKLPSSKDNDKASSIAKGCIIGFPIVIVLLILLTSADHYFSEFISSIINSIEVLLDLDFLFGDVIWPFMIIFMMFFISILNVIRHKDEELKDITIRNNDNVILTTILLMVDFIFTLFLISQVSKITNNFLNLPEEYTYAGYAREGFFQLLLVTFINFGIIIYYIYKTNSIKENKNIKTLLLLLIFFSILLIFNSYYRMLLYINAYGFTTLRLQVMLFLAMEFIIFMLFIKKIVSNYVFNEGLVFTIIILTTYVLNLYLATENFINLIN